MFNLTTDKKTLYSKMFLLQLSLFIYQKLCKVIRAKNKRS